MLRPNPIGPGLQGFAARTPTLPPATHTNSYALGTRDLLLVEPATPYAEEQRAWLGWARSLVSQGRKLRAVFVTHHHVDHVGGAAALSGELGVPLWGHALTAERLPELRFERRLEDGDVITLEGQEPERWEVLHTPGHAPGHLCLLERQSGTLVVGDMVASEGTILIEPNDGDMAVYLTQLERLAALGAERALPAHGAPIEAPTALFRHYIAHRLEREGKVLEALRTAGSGGATPAELVPIAYSDTPKQAWPLAVMSLAAHLGKLVHDGAARLDEERYFST